MNREVQSFPGNWSALIVAVWGHTLPQIITLDRDTFELREWTLHYRMVERECGDFQNARIGPLAEETNLNEVRGDFRTFEDDEVGDFTWVQARHLPRTTSGGRLRLKVRGLLLTVVFRILPYLLPLFRCPRCQTLGTPLTPVDQQYGGIIHTSSPATSSAPDHAAASSVEEHMIPGWRTALTTAKPNRYTWI